MITQESARPGDWYAIPCGDCYHIRQKTDTLLDGFVHIARVDDGYMAQRICDTVNTNDDRERADDLERNLLAAETGLRKRDERIAELEAEVERLKFWEDASHNYAGELANVKAENAALRADVLRLTRLSNMQHAVIGGSKDDGMEINRLRQENSALRDEGGRLLEACKAFDDCSIAGGRDFDEMNLYVAWRTTLKAIAGAVMLGEKNDLGPGCNKPKDLQ